MILCDPSVTANFRDYGIMLPISRDRGKQVLDFLIKNTPDKFKVFDFLSAQSYLELNSEKVLGKLPGKLLKPPLNSIVRLDQDKYLLNREDLERIHSKTFIEQLYTEGLSAAILDAFELIDEQGRPNRYEPERAVRPLSDLFQVLLTQAGGTYLACLLALTDNVLRDTPKKSGFCYYLGGGMHHARYDTPSGFCLINDVAAAAVKIASEKPARLIWIIDMDAHKGDGTAELIYFARKRSELKTPAEEFAQSISDNDKPCILTLSIHMAKGWPLDNENLASAEEGRAPLLPSDVDIGIDSGEEDEYSSRLMDGIHELEKISGRTPDFVLVVDGADPYEHDGLSSSSLLRLTLEQCVERDMLVYRYLQDKNIPSAWIQAGGYGGRAWEPAAHFLMNI